MESPLFHDPFDAANDALGVNGMEVESVSDAATALSEVKLSNKERIYEECFDEIKRFWTNLADDDLVFIFTTGIILTNSYLHSNLMVSC